MSGHQPPVVDDHIRQCFVVTEGGDEAYLRYRRHDDRLVLVHTEVAPALEGHGLAGDLIRAAVDEAVANELTVVPLCPMARSWLMRHPDVAHRVTISWAQAADD